MLIPNPEVLVAQIVTFAIGMGAVWVIYLKPLGSHLKGRREGIERDLASAETARNEAAKLKSEFTAEKARLLEDNRRLMEKTKADADAFRAELMAKAKSEHESLIIAGRAQIHAERAEAVRQIRAQAASLVIEATGKLLEKNLNNKAQAALAEKFVKAIKVSKN
jgi:F-type H+-transporting ATPase subunit b